MFKSFISFKLIMKALTSGVCKRARAIVCNCVRACARVRVSVRVRARGRIDSSQPP